ncbi:hypothetical protein MNBD_GAMMA22-1989 [hydrothermal vent metagenome]|uniref:DUF4340 domain-containing protein n=1 Tax=hydrothermal vent metagenome TaxID=652676 RepID=A0A3B1A724_9ZZZZ
MNSRTSLNIFLFLFVATLIAILFIDTEKSITTYQLSSLNENQVTTIEITRQTGKALTFNKKNNLWYMTSPYEVQANTFYIESLLRITQAKSISQFTISKEDKNKFKLNPAQATLKLNQQLFSFGTNEALNLNRYILSNDKLYLIPDRYFYLLNSTTTGYIDHALIGKQKKIIGLELENHKIQLLNGKWQTTPKLKNNSADNIIQLISEWNNSQAIEISEFSDIANSDKKLSVKIFIAGNKKPIIFDVVITDENYFFIRVDLKLQFKLNHDMAKRLLTIPNQVI